MSIYPNLLRTKMFCYYWQFVLSQVENQTLHMLNHFQQDIV
jgi:hypothetical protein